MKPSSSSARRRRRAKRTRENLWTKASDELKPQTDSMQLQMARSLGPESESLPLKRARPFDSNESMDIIARRELEKVKDELHLSKTAEIKLRQEILDQRDAHNAILTELQSKMKQTQAELQTEKSNHQAAVKLAEDKIKQVQAGFLQENDAHQHVVSTLEMKLEKAARELQEKENAHKSEMECWKSQIEHAQTELEQEKNAHNRDIDDLGRKAGEAAKELEREKSVHRAEVEKLEKVTHQDKVGYNREELKKQAAHIEDLTEEVKDLKSEVFQNKAEEASKEELRNKIASLNEELLEALAVTSDLRTELLNANREVELYKVGLQAFAQAKSSSDKDESCRGGTRAILLGFGNLAYIIKNISKAYNEGNMETGAKPVKYNQEALQIRGGKTQGVEICTWVRKKDWYKDISNIIVRRLHQSPGIEEEDILLAYPTTQDTPTPSRRNAPRSCRKSKMGPASTLD
ncbi:hypothetical protein FOL47_001077 [Perkinsus chesapeaki]|uniref:Uncharacterized protein n=1 Tax=Perkinsus chesapeaki TaxID=330153 RepID=A0A7J6KUI6_PERCH|nr:hypothetical protein FOL47_001077 [Perkinsus chesapeaki]